MCRRSRTESIVMGGNKTEREVLANLIERGRKSTLGCSEIFDENVELIPQVSEPIEEDGVSGFFLCHCYRLNAIGYAIMGLDGFLPHLAAAYEEQRLRAKVAKTPCQYPGYAAAADMLGLPIALLWKA